VSGNLDPGDRLTEGAAVLVIDVQNDFCHEDGGLCKLGAYDLELIQPMVPKLSAFVDAARAGGIPVVWVKTEYDDATTSSRWSRRHGGEEVRICRPGTWGAEWYGLDPADNEIVVVKHRYSPFVNAPLETVLRARGFETLLLTGVTTNVCVESTARDAFMRDYQVVVVSDCVAASDPATNEASLQNIRRHFGAVLSSQDIERIWAGREAGGIAR
jgi:ureidoacrylate peracid hydrolase